MSDELAIYASGIQSRRRGEPLGPSSVGACFRQSAYRYHGTPTSEPGCNTDAADVGTLLHLGYSAMITSMYEPEHHEADVLITIPGLPRPGTADEVDWDNHIVVDLKGAGAHAWQGMVDRGDVYRNYWDQIQLYAYGLDLIAPGDWTLRILLLNRDTGERAIFDRKADPRVGRNLALKLEDRHDRLSRSVEDGGSPEAFPREGKGPGTGLPCDWCPWLTHCWPRPEGDSDLSPQSSTTVDDPVETEAWAKAYIEAQQEEIKAKTIKQEAAVFLRGIKGTFGAYKVSYPGGRPKGDVVDCDAAADLLRENGYTVPTKDGGVTPKYVRVNRVNKP